MAALSGRHAAGTGGHDTHPQAPESAPQRMHGIGYPDLWDSLYEAPLCPAHAAEVERRLDGMAEDVPHAVTWDGLKAELAAR